MRVQVLNLDFCTLSSLPMVLGQLTALTTLDVEGNLYLGDSFRSAATTPTSAGPITLAPQPFPLDLAGLQQLRYLNLNSCGLTTIPTVSLFAILHDEHSQSIAGLLTIPHTRIKQCWYEDRVLKAMYIAIMKYSRAAL